MLLLAFYTSRDYSLLSQTFSIRRLQAVKTFDCNQGWLGGTKRGERTEKGQRVATIPFRDVVEKWRDFFKRVVNRSSFLSESKMKKNLPWIRKSFLAKYFSACKMTDKKGRRIEKKGKALKGFYTIWHLMVCRNVIFMRESLSAALLLFT